MQGYDFLLVAAAIVGISIPFLMAWSIWTAIQEGAPMTTTTDSEESELEMRSEEDGRWI